MARKIIRAAVTQAAKEFESEIQGKKKKRPTVKDMYDELRPKNPEIVAKPQSFSDKFEEELKKSLFEQREEVIEIEEVVVDTNLYQKSNNK